jgi:K+-sensing histidine kinase KdpD
MSAREVLLDPRQGQVNVESTRQVLSVMARGITRLGALSQIVRDLIDIADLQQGRASVNLSQSDVRQVVHRAVEEVSTLAGLYPTNFQINLEGDGPSVTADVPRVRRAILHILGYCQRTVSAPEVVSISGRLVQDAYEITIQPRRGTRPDQGARARVQQVVREEASEALERRGRYLSLLVAHGYIAACGGQLRLDASEAGLRSVTCTLPLSRNTT